MNTENFRYFFPKVLTRLAVEKNRLWKHVDVEKWAMRGYTQVEDADALKCRIAEMLGAFTRDMLLDVPEEEKKTIIACADQALCHEFDLLGSGVVRLDPIDWHIDFKSGPRWEKKYYNEIGFIKGADIKVPWELSRCQHLLWLGEAYLLTGKAQYAQEIINEIRWWIEDNPLMYTVNWKCSMDVAFRAVNWIFALNMIKAYEGYDDSFAKTIERSLWQHGFFIKNNLEKSVPYSNNHYTSDLVGLLYIGQLFNDSRRGKGWKRKAKKELEKEILTQVLPSGVHYEKSVSYHRMMTEMLSYPIYMLERMGESFPKEVKARIMAMYAYVSNYTKPNGLSPLIADNDDGRFLPFVPRDFGYHNYLNNEQSLENKIISVDLKPKFCCKRQGNNLYKDANIAIIREKNNYLFINGGGYSRVTKNKQQFINSHTHNDALSFELVVEGQDVIVDSGTYLYTSDIKMRNAFRSTAKHNTVVVDGEEQNEFVDAFSLRRNIIIGGLYEENNTLAGNYQTIQGNMTHRRSFGFTGNGVELKDNITKEGHGHVAKFYFHFADGLNLQVEEKTVKVNGICMTFGLPPKHIDIVDDIVSPSYGLLNNSKTLVVSYNFDNELEIITKIIYE